MSRKSAIGLGIFLVLAMSTSVFLYTRHNESAAPQNDESQEPAEEQGRPITLVLVGDIMLDRGVRIAINREGEEYPFFGVRSLFTGADLVVGNLEGTFTDEASVALPGSGVLRFTFDPGLAGMLKSFGFNGFSLANNHALDFYRAGFDSTKKVLEGYGMFHFGHPINSENLSAGIQVEEEELCFVGYHQLFEADTSPVVGELNALRESDACSYIIVFAHWGDEYQDEENEHQRAIGRAFIDAGADLVIGHHPHVVQPIEIYKGKAIFYSLGNFLFDQDFSIETLQGLAVRLTLSEEEQRFHLIPTQMSRARLFYPEKEAYQPRMDILISKLPEPHRTTADVDSEFTLPR